MNEKSAVTKGTWAAGFSVASVWFGTHVGAGFATGNQVLSYFVNYGWTAVIFPLISMGMLAYVIYVIMKFARLRGLDNYNDTFRELWSPYPWLAITFEIFYIVIINDLFLILNNDSDISIIICSFHAMNRRN